MIAHKDRIPVEITQNGAIRHGVYDKDGKLLRYEYIKREDGALVSGTAVNKRVLDEFLAASGVAGGTASAFTLEQEGFHLVDGATVRVQLHLAPHAGENGMVTLNVSGTGAVALRGTRGKPFKRAIAGVWITVVYSAQQHSFILQGEGGVEGVYGNDVGQISSFELAMTGFNPNYRKVL